MTKGLSWPFKGSGKIFTAVLVLVLIMAASVLIGLSQPALAQEDEPEEGDYRSIDSGYWDDLANWEVYNGTDWVPATYYPGEQPGDYIVTIQSGHDMDDNNVGTLYFGDLIIYGRLSLSHYLTLDSTEYLLVDGEYFNGIDTRTGGAIYWYAKVRLSLPADATLDVRNIKDDYGQVIDGLGLYAPHAANNNMRIRIGDVDYAAAVGGGNVVTFDMINAAGGALAAIATADPDDIEYSGVVLQTTLTGEATGLGSDPAEAELQFYWTGTGPGSFNFNSYEQNPGLVDLNGGYGIYTFTFTVTSTYAGFTYSTSDDAVVTVHPAPLTITANDQTKVYGETLIFDGTEFVATGLLYDDNVTSVTLTSDGTISTAAVWTYTIVPSEAVGTGVENYDINYVDGTLTINPLTIYVTADAQSKTYGDADPALTYSYTPALIGGDTFNGELARDTGDDADTYAITQGTLALSDNYILGYTGADLTINPLTIYVTADAQSKTYGDVDPVLTYSYTPALIGGDTFSGEMARDTGEDADTYAITQGTLALSDNYILDYTGADLTINPLTIYVTADAQSKTYGDADPALTYSYTPGLIGGDTFSGELARDAGENVGTYAITQGTLALNDNYILDYTGADLTINPLTIYVTADAQSKTYGDADPVLTYSYTPALIGGDTFSGELARDTGEDVGTYAITQGTLALNDNYILDYTGADLTINPLTIYVTADAQSKTYGDADPALTYSYTPGLIGGDTFSGELARDAGENVGTYVITQGTLALNDNYILDYTGADLIIKPMALTIYITADAQSKTYGDADPVLTYSYTPALIGGDTFSGELARDTGEDVGTYAITQGTLALNDNYILDYTGADLTVTPKALTIAANNQTKVYGDTVTFAGTEFAATGLVNADTVDSVTLSSDGAMDSAMVAGSPYTIVPSAAVGVGLENYTISYVNGNLTINKAVVVCSLSSSASTSTHGHLVTFTATVTGTGAAGTVIFKDGDIFLGGRLLRNGTATYSTSDLSIASHSITAFYGGDANFASITSLPVDVTVNKGINWWLIGGIIAVVLALGLVIFFLWRWRRRAALLAS